MGLVVGGEGWVEGSPGAVSGWCEGRRSSSQCCSGRVCLACSLAPLLLVGSAAASGVFSCFHCKKWQSLCVAVLAGLIMPARCLSLTVHGVGGQLGVSDGSIFSFWWCGWGGCGGGCWFVVYMAFLGMVVAYLALWLPCQSAHCRCREA